MQEEGQRGQPRSRGGSSSETRHSRTSFHHVNTQPTNLDSPDQLEAMLSIQQPSFIHSNPFIQPSIPQSLISPSPSISSEELSSIRRQFIRPPSPRHIFNPLTSSTSSLPSSAATPQYSSISSSDLNPRRNSQLSGITSSPNSRLSQLAINIPPSNPDLYPSGSPITPSTSGSGSSNNTSASIPTPPITASLPFTSQTSVQVPSTQPILQKTSVQSFASSSVSNIPTITTPSLPNVFEGLKVTRPYSSNPVPVGFGGVTGDWVTDEVKDQLVKEERRRRNKESSQKHRDRAKEKRREQDIKMEYLENRVIELERENDELKDELGRARLEIQRLQQLYGIMPGMELTQQPQFFSGTQQQVFQQHSDFSQTSSHGQQQ